MKWNFVETLNYIKEGAIFIYTFITVHTFIPLHIYTFIPVEFVRLATLYFAARQVGHKRGNTRNNVFQLAMQCSCLGRECGENVTRYKSFISHVHLVMTLWYPRPPNSMLCRCCDLRNLRNRKINIVWEEGECFQGDRKPITLEILLKNQPNYRLENGKVCCENRLHN